MRMGRGGRTPKITSETIEGIAQDVRQGVPLAAAAERRGISRKTLYNFVTLAKNGQKGRAAELAGAVAKAKAERVSELARATYQAALRGDARTALRLLEIWEPSEFPKDSIRVEHTGEMNAGSNVDWPRWFWASLTDIELRVLEIVSMRNELLRESGGDEAAYMAKLANDKEVLNGLAELERVWKQARSPWRTQV